MKCNKCSLNSHYIPQIRWIGKKYEEKRILFVQLNPGAIGNLEDWEIEDKYKKQPWRIKFYKEKKELATKLFEVQEIFKNDSTIEHWEKLQITLMNAMHKWGNSKYKSTYIDVIERHGIKIDEIAISNIALCPTPSNKYQKYLTPCWESWTKDYILNILKPKLVVAQGRRVFSFLNKRLNWGDFDILLGVHHSHYYKENPQFAKVKRRIEIFKKIQ